MRHFATVSVLSLAVLGWTQGAAAAPSDPCAILPPAQVSAAVGAPVSAGASTGHTCTWKATDNGVKGVAMVTLFLQSGASYEAGRKLAGQMGPQSMVPLSGVGDSAYYFVAGTAVGLLARKGSSAFKAAVYGQAPLAKKEAMEKALASAVVGRL